MKAILVFILVFLKWTVVNLVMAIPHAIKGAYRTAYHPYRTSSKKGYDKPRFVGPYSHHHDNNHGDYDRSHSHYGHGKYHHRQSRW